MMIAGQRLHTIFAIKQIHYCAVLHIYSGKIRIVRFINNRCLKIYAPIYEDILLIKKTYYLNQIASSFQSSSNILGGILEHDN